MKNKKKNKNKILISIKKLIRLKKKSKALEEYISYVNLLKKLLEKKEKLAEKYLSALQYLQADFENYKKRIKKENEEFKKFANLELINELLNVMDSFDLATNAINNKTYNNIEKLTEGINIIKKQLINILKNNEVEKMEKVVGSKFDPTKHEAVMVKQEKEIEDNTVIQEIRSGYTLAGRVIRPAQVIVAKKEV